MKRKILFLSAIILAFIVSATGLRQALAEVRFADDKIILNGTIKQTAYLRTQMNSAEYKRYHRTHLDYNRFSALYRGAVQNQGLSRGAVQLYRRRQILV